MEFSRESNRRRRLKQNLQIERVRNTILILAFRVIVALTLIGGFMAAGAGIGAYWGILQNSPQLNLLSMTPDIYTSFIYDRNGNEMTRLSTEEERIYAKFDQFPENLVNAFLAIEDERFYSHNGIDFRGMARALYYTLTDPERLEGASTITQQVIKNMLNKDTNDIISKLQEQYLAIQFEKRLADPENFGSTKAAKDYILESYLNMINLGHGYYGVQSASWNYFGKDVSELTLSECAVIAAITNNPAKYRPNIWPEKNRYRQELVLKNMLRLEMITEEEFQEAWDDPVYDRVIPGVVREEGYSALYSYFEDAVIEQVAADLQRVYFISEKEAYRLLFYNGLQIYSTQDTEIQRIMEDVLSNEENYPDIGYEIDVEYIISYKNNITERTSNVTRKRTVRNQEQVEAFIESVKDELLTANDVVLAERTILTEQPQASAIMLDYNSGHVVGMVGGRGEKTVSRAFNRTTKAYRSPGSQFKVLAAYAPGIDLGIFTAATMIEDAPYTVDEAGLPEPWSPRNWYTNPPFEGWNSVRRGIYRSMNVLAAKAYQQVGPEVALAYLKNFGFTSLEGTLSNGRAFTSTHPSVPLGGLTRGVNQIELVSAFGAIANKGTYNTPILYTKVLDHDGNVILENEPESRQVLKTSSAYILTNIMLDTVRGVSGSTGTAASLGSMPVAGKTGTSTDSVDLSFSGYTPYYACSVWMGYDQQKALPNGIGSTHLSLWKKIMERVHENLPVRQFERPDNIVEVVICKDSGLLPTETCSRDPSGGKVVTEIFEFGTAPTEYCDLHQEVCFCNVSWKFATEYCPEETKYMDVGVVRPWNPEPVGEGGEPPVNPALCDVHHAVTEPEYPEYPDVDDDYWWLFNTPVPTQQEYFWWDAPQTSAPTSTLPPFNWTDPAATAPPPQNLY